MNPVTILLVDDNEMFIRLTTRFLNQSPADLRVIGSCTKGSQATQCVRQFQPDLVLLDMAMPDMHGLVVLSMLHAEFPQLPVVVLTLLSSTYFHNMVINKGARGFVNKAMMYSDLLPAINRAVELYDS